MTQEEKAKHYDEALARAREWSETKNGYYMPKELCEEIFPELKESEEEKIRKVIRGWIYTQPDSFFDNGISKEVMLAWLEKQGEQKLAKDIIDAWKDMRFEVYAQASGNRHEANYSDNTTKMFSLNDIDEIIEKISEQKSADKVEPKFHEGEWVTNGIDCTFQIASIEDGIYYDTNNCGSDIKSTDKSYHLWGIKDARDGDVLVTNSNIIFIFKSLDEGGTIAFRASCTKNSGAYFPKLKERLCDQDVYPATKEQRDALMKAMEDAGYEFDFEKIEQKPTWREIDWLKSIKLKMEEQQ